MKNKKLKYKYPFRIVKVETITCTNERLRVIYTHRKKEKKQETLKYNQLKLRKLKGEHRSRYFSSCVFQFLVKQEKKEMVHCQIRKSQM